METETQRVERVTTVVVVDDDPDYLWVVRFILESGPDKTAIVGETASGEEALALVLRKCPDLVIADLMMPRLNGLELTRSIKEARPQTKVLLVSAYTEDTYRRLASVSGADGFLNKNLIHTGLLPAIREVIRPQSVSHEPPPLLLHRLIRQSSRALRFVQESGASGRGSGQFFPGTFSKAAPAFQRVTCSSVPSRGPKASFHQMARALRLSS